MAHDDLGRWVPGTSGNPGGLTWITGVGADDRATIDWILGTVQPGDAQVAALRASHAVASAIVSRYATQLQPFALYLRSFEVEALRADAPGWVGDDARYVEFMNAPSVAERSLSAKLAPRIDVLTVAHPGNRFVRPDPGWLPRLQIDDADWRTVVSQLMQRASMIFVELIHLSPGLREELDLLVSAGVQSRTLLMVDRAASDEAAQQRLQQQLFGRPSGAVTIDPDDPLLRAFRRVLGVAGVEAGAPQLADLLREAAFVRGLDPQQRTARNDALGLADTAAQLLGSVQSPTDAVAPQAAVDTVARAALLGLQARATFDTLQDALSLASVSTLLALATAMLGDRAKLHDAIDWVMDAAASLTAEERAGLVLRLRPLAEIPLIDPVQTERFRALFPTLPPDDGALGRRSAV